MDDLFKPTKPIIEQNVELYGLFNVKTKKPKKKTPVKKILTPESSDDSSEEEPEIVQEVDDSSEEQIIDEPEIRQPVEPTIEAFWNLIDRIGWVNRSDLVMNETFVQNTIRQWGQNDVVIFKTFYSDLLSSAVDTLRNKFPDYDINTITEIASHFIALGKDWHAQVVEFSEFASIIITMQDYQNFHAVVPDDLKK